MDRQKEERCDDPGCGRESEIGRHDAAEATRVETDDPIAVKGHLQYDASNEESGYDEKYVHADKAAGDPKHVGMIEQYQRHRDEAQAINVVNIFAAFPRRARILHHVFASTCHGRDRAGCSVDSDSRHSRK
ncbi:hypothetical protein NE850_35265 [Paraburkholderia sp. USG1]|nr:hypothetical protein [Paraburkholderia sp. USG1]MDR8401596.1 hypothetical protein [Paraburkholderia sp. USG1]